MDEVTLISSALSFIQNMTQAQLFWISVSVAFCVRKSHVYRYIRTMSLPMGILALLVSRYRSDITTSLLTIMIDAMRGSNAKINLLIQDILGIMIFSLVLRILDGLISLDLIGTKNRIFRYGFELVKDLSFVQSILQEEANKVEKEFDEGLKSHIRTLGTANTVLPKFGQPGTKLLKLIKTQAAKEHTMWQEGKLSGGVYHGGAEHYALLNKAFAEYSMANPLHADIWPSLMKFESEIIAMTASLVSGGCTTICGATTSGGTESIICAIKTHRDFYRDNFGITEPEMVVGNSAHAAVDKACDLLGIKLIKVALDPKTFKIDLAAMERAIGPNTIMMYGSAPSFPHGVIDPISELGGLAVQYSIGLHIDCCLGGFFLPFARKLGHKVPDFDFSVPGVSSMSLDTHKYGFALKGASVVLYRNKDLRHSQYFCYSDWTGGMYTTATIAGSRSGGMIAQCWTSLMSTGEEGYMKTTAEILDVVRTLAEGIQRIPGLQLVGQAQAMLVCFRPVSVETVDGTTRTLNVYTLGDKMGQLGWHVNATQNPPCMNICCTFAHVGKENVFLADLRKCAADILANPGEIKGKAAIYGLTAQLPAAPVNELMKVYNDVVLSI